MAGVPSLLVVAQCGGSGRRAAAWTPTARRAADTVRFDIHAAQITLRDSAAPAVAALTGPLAEAGRTHAGTTTVTAQATDAGAGVASFTLEVDGQAVASAAAPGCQAEPYTLRTPCPTSIGQSLELDTTKLAYGRHSARVVARDASGNATPSPALDVLVDNRRRRGLRRGAELRLRHRAQRHPLQAAEREAGAARRRRSR